MAWAHRIKTLGGGVSPQTITAAGAGVGITFDDDQTGGSSGFFSFPSSSNTRILAQGAGSQGVYRFLAGVHFDPDVDQAVVLHMSGGAFGWFPSFYWKAPFRAGAAQRTDLAAVLDFVVRLETTANMDSALVVTTNGATDMSCDSAELTISYLGTWPGTGDADLSFP